MRCFKTVNDAYIEPISFIVPRRAEVFQGDIYPPTTGIKPAASSSEWFNGKTGLPPKISLEDVYEGQAPKEIPSDYKPRAAATPISSPPPTKTEMEPPKPAPAAAPVAAQRGPAPTMNENKASIASMANKFADQEEESSEDETSSFEEVPKPVERPSATVSRMEEKTRGPEIKKEPEPARTVAPAASRSTDTPAQSTPVTSPPPTASSAAAGAAAGIKDYLSDIKSMLATQSDQISSLTKEVNFLKAKVGEQRSDREKDERIRELELELEAARS